MCQLHTQGKAPMAWKTGHAVRDCIVFSGASEAVIPSKQRMQRTNKKPKAAAHSHSGDRPVSFP